MPFKQLSKIHISLAILVIGFVIYFYIYEKPLYGNDKKSIEQVIKSVEGYENGSVEILEMKDFGNERVVAFLFDHSPAYIQFKKNKQGNYKWNYLEKKPGESFGEFLVKLDNDEPNNVKFMIVTNEDNNIARLELGINNRPYNINIKPNTKTVAMLDLPKKENHGYTFTYKYYDKLGNLIEVAP